jgi:hypothetical protein
MLLVEYHLWAHVILHISTAKLDLETNFRTGLLSADSALKGGIPSSQLQLQLQNQSSSKKDSTQLRDPNCFPTGKGNSLNMHHIKKKHLHRMENNLIGTFFVIYVGTNIIVRAPVGFWIAQTLKEFNWTKNTKVPVVWYEEIEEGTCML